MPLPAKIQKILTTCRRKRLTYWVTAAVFAVIGYAVSHGLDSVTAWLDLKYSAYVVMQNLRGGPDRVPQVVLVGIGDNEFYGHELQARRPLKRDYLARLVAKLAEANPRLIGLDVDFRSPVPESEASDFDAYAAEDRALVTALCDAQANTPIVISKAVYGDSIVPLRAERNVYDGIDAPCPVPGGRIASGYLALPTDLRRVPLSVRLTDGSTVDSFALAIARSLARRQYPSALEVERLPYGRFRAASAFQRIDADAVMQGRERDALDGQVVIVYGDWHVLAKGRGSSFVDAFRTPVGTVGGAFVHANLVETLLAAEYTLASPEQVAIVVEFLIALGLAVAFAFPMSLLRKFGYLAATAGVLFVAAWLSFQVFAVFFDILPILASMYLHTVADQVWEWRQAAHGHGH
jgi:CHASE2 domain-containing sensor protein